MSYLFPRLRLSAKDRLCRHLRACCDAGLKTRYLIIDNPLAGLPEADGFHLDQGRLCVLLTRHRQACIVVGREGDRDLLEDQVPPPAVAYLGWDPDPVLDGWDVHREVFAALEAVRAGV